MTSDALSVPVLALERVLGVPIVIEDSFLPVLGRMAGLTLVAKLPLVPLVVVFLPMAFDALGRQLLDGLYPRERLEAGLVAALALRGLVFPFERILGVLVMVEACLLPSLLVVAGLALVAQTPLMSLLVVILAVASKALRLQLLDV